jgi:hypothetical protein
LIGWVDKWIHADRQTGSGVSRHLPLLLLLLLACDITVHVGRVGFSRMHEGCRDDRIFSFRFGVGAGGCMQGRVACRSRSRRVATHVVMCWRCELWLEFMIRIAYRECSGHMIDTVATFLVRIDFVLHTTARMLWPMFEVIARYEQKTHERLETTWMSSMFGCFDDLDG